LLACLGKVKKSKKATHSGLYVTNCIICFPSGILESGCCQNRKQHAYPLVHGEGVPPVAVLASTFISQASITTPLSPSNSGGGACGVWRLNNQGYVPPHIVLYVLSSLFLLLASSNVLSWLHSYSSCFLHRSLLTYTGSARNLLGVRCFSSSAE